MSDGLLVLLPCLVAWVLAVAGGPAGWPLFAVAAAQSLALVWYRRLPLAVLLTVTALELVLATTGAPLFVGVLVAAAGLGAWGTARNQRIGVAVVSAVLVLILVRGLLTKTEALADGVAFLVVLVLFLGFWLVGRHSARQRGRIRELDAYTRRLEAERELVAEHERALLARELHDILNHSVTAMVLDAEAATDGDEDDTRATLRRVADTGRASLAELRRLLSVLRKGSLGAEHDPLAVPPRLADLDALVAAIPDGGPRVRLTRHGHVRPVDASVELAGYRVVQESLTNVAKHAGAVDVDARITYAPGGIDVRVTNARPVSAPAPGPGGMGLVGMRERVELVGGTLTAAPTASGGFALHAFLPVRVRA